MQILRRALYDVSIVTVVLYLTVALALYFGLKLEEWGAIIGLALMLVIRALRKHDAGRMKAPAKYAITTTIFAFIALAPLFYAITKTENAIAEKDLEAEKALLAGDDMAFSSSNDALDYFVTEYFADIELHKRQDCSITTSGVIEQDGEVYVKIEVDEERFSKDRTYLINARTKALEPQKQ